LKASNSRPDQEIFFETGYIIWCSNVNYHIITCGSCTNIAGWRTCMYTLYGQNVKDL
jgi:hypothetical protein